MTSLYLSNTGNISTTPIANPALALNVTTFSYLAGASLDVSFFGKVTSPAQPDDFTMRLRIFDTTTGDEIYKVEGTINVDPENLASIVARADALEVFEQFDLTFTELAVSNAILASDAFNASNSLGRNKEVFVLDDEIPPGFNADQTYDLITNLVEKPAYLTLPKFDSLPIYVCLLRVAEKLNIPLDVELDPTISPEQAADLAVSIDAQSIRVQFIWSPNLCRPRDAVSLKGRKVPAYYIGQYIGDKLLRNARTNAQGYAPIEQAVAWKDYAFKAKALELRKDVILGEPVLEMLAKAKVNIVRPIRFDQVRYVLSDILTQYQSKNSALRLVTCAEIAMRSSNQAVEILKSNMLKPTPTYIEKASRDIDDYLSGAATAGWFQGAEELGGKPYAFSLVPDETHPFERVRLKLARRPVGSTRAVIFDEDVVVK